MDGDAPMWFQQLSALGRRQGFLTYAQVNDLLPASIVDPVEIDGIAKRLETFGFKVVPDSADEV